MEEIGKVIKLDKKYATVRFNRRSACASCGLCGIKDNDAHIDVRVKNTINADIEDKVLVKMKDSSVLISSIIVYLIPVVFMFIGVILGYFFLKQIWAQLLLAVGCLAISFPIIYLFDKKLKYIKKFSPEMVEIYKEEKQDEKE